MKRTLIGLGSLVSLCACSQKPNTPNIVLFLVDDMGWQETSVPFADQITSLNKRYHTPNMERLAAMGMKFTNAYANSISSPSRASLLTGANVTQHKISNWTLHKNQSTDAPSEQLIFGGWNYNGLSPANGIKNTFYAKTLPQILKEYGYTTLMVGKAHFGAIDTPAANPKVLGFDYTIAGHAAGAMGSYLGEECYGANKNSNQQTNIWAVPDLEAYHGSDVFLTEALTIEANKLIDLALTKEKPFFLYLSHYAVHAPFGKDTRYYEKYINHGLSDKEARFAALIEGMDKSLGDVIDHLEKQGELDNTVILFMSDNGGYAVGREGANAPAKLGKGSLYEGGIREPMIAYWQGVVQPNSICKSQVHIDDFFPSILEIANASNARVPQIVDGVSFIPLLKGEAPQMERVLYFHYPNSWGERTGGGGIPQSAIIEGSWKYIYDYETQEKHLFNLANDLAEENNLANDSQYEGQKKQLEMKLCKRLKEYDSPLPRNKQTKKSVNYPDGTLCKR